MEDNELIIKVLELMKDQPIAYSMENKFTEANGGDEVSENRIDYLLEEMVDNDWIKPQEQSGRPNKYTSSLRPKGRKLIMEEAEKLKLEILNKIKPSFHSGQSISINDVLEKSWQHKTTGDLGSMLRGMSSINYIFNNGNDFRHLIQNPNTTIPIFLTKANLTLKLLKDGYNHLESLNQKEESKGGDTFHFNGSQVNLINRSDNSNIKLSSEELEKAIPQLIELIKDMRSTDLDLLLAAVQDMKEGKQIEPGKFDRVIALMANTATIISLFTPKL